MFFIAATALLTILLTNADVQATAREIVSQNKKTEPEPNALFFSLPKLCANLMPLCDYQRGFGGADDSCAVVQNNIFVKDGMFNNAVISYIGALHENGV